ncbi:uncharacterized protein LOC135845720 isoform X1 [Planococcus citri]|uniref:uncharacterized protein LOC135845720 isoform X1 n=1 Tax=Planococcus citri TaxID=170843 RepID=UPI0031F9D012
MPTEVKNEILDFFSTFYSNLVKGNLAIQKVILTGIIPWKNADITSSLLSINTYTIMDNFPMNAYGFSEKDLHAMYEYVKAMPGGLPDTEQDLINFYDGYLFGDDIKRYNPISVVHYFNAIGNNRLLCYWGETGEAKDVLRQLLKFRDFNMGFMSLLTASNGTLLIENTPDNNFLTLSRQSMEILSHCIDCAVQLPPQEWYWTANSNSYLGFSLLFATGYVTKHRSSNTTHLILTIPNEDVRRVLWNTFRDILVDERAGSPKIRSQFRRAMESFTPYLKEITKTDQTDCKNLIDHFHNVLIELPLFSKTPQKYMYYYSSEALIESILMAAFHFYIPISLEEQHDFKKTVTRDSKTVGRPDVVIFSPDHTFLTVFELGLDINFNAAYKQCIKYLHVYLLNDDYKNIEKMKIIPFVVTSDTKAVRANATICTRTHYFEIKHMNDHIERTVKIIRDDLPSVNTTENQACRKACNDMLGWTEYNYLAKNHKEEFNVYANKVINECPEKWKETFNTINNSIYAG